MASDFPQITLSPLEQLIIKAIVENGSPAAVYQKGYMPPQVAAALRILVGRGILFRKDRDFRLNPSVQLSTKKSPAFSPISVRQDMKVEKLGLNDSFEIGRQTISQIRNRIRSDGESH